MEAIAYDERGLVPCVIQDWSTGEVLTLAYMNAEALERTRATGALHLWSRSRGELWRKGATSGNTQAVRALRYDCDADTILALVEPAGPACHTGKRTCFHRGEMDLGPHEALPALERTIAARAAERPDGSYTAALLADPPQAAVPVGVHPVPRGGAPALRRAGAGRRTGDAPVRVRGGVLDSRPPWRRSRTTSAGWCPA